MGSISVPACSQCMRLLRRSICTEIATTSNYRNIPIRALSTTSSRWLREPAKQQDASPQPPFPPTTTGTVTSNITAASPPSSEFDISTAEMQKAIQTGLSSSGGPSLASRVAAGLRSAAPSATESYISYGQSEAFFKSCGRQADYTIPPDQRQGLLAGDGPPKNAEGIDLGVPVPALGDEETGLWWFKTIGLEPTFSTWSQVAFLHMYILTVRLRAISDQSVLRNYQRYLIEHFSQAAEDKMQLLHNMGARGIRNQYLKDLFLQWRGILAAYDEGLLKGDAVLATAIWRNLFRGDEKVDWEKVALVVAYTRKAISLVSTHEIDDLASRLKDGNELWSTTQHDLAGLVAQKGSLPPLPRDGDN